MCDDSQKNTLFLLRGNHNEGDIWKLSEEGNSKKLLLLAAIGSSQGVPDVFGFYELFYELGHLFSNEEKVQGLEVLGSTYVLRRDFSEGLKYWKKSLSLRLTPRTPLPPADLPPVTSKLFEREWLTSEDLNRLARAQQPAENAATDADEDNPSFDWQLELIYQAMLVRLRHCKSNLSSDLLILIKSHQEWFTMRESVTSIKFYVLLLEWDELCASHSLRVMDNSNAIGSIFRDFTYISLVLANTCHKHLMRSENVMVIFKWLTTEVENRSFSRDKESIGSAHLLLYYVMEIVLLTILSGASPTDEASQDFNVFKTCLERIVAADLRDSVYGQDLLLAYSYYSDSNIGVPLSVHKRFVRLLIEAGANIKSTDRFGKNCLHYLIDNRYRELLSVPMFKFLLDCGVCWDAELSEEIRNIAESQGFFSLQWLCARVVRRENIHLNSNVVPKAIIKFVNDY